MHQHQWILMYKGDGTRVTKCLSCDKEEHFDYVEGHRNHLAITIVEEGEGDDDD